jgi:hypothetical protein
VADTGGRPTEYTPEIAAEICRRLAAGESLRSIVSTEGMPAQSTVYLWVSTNREGFSEQYTRAREAQADFFADEILEIADDSAGDWVERKGSNGYYMALDKEAVLRSKLKVDARIWVMGKLHPKKYGKVSRHEHSGPGGGPIQIGPMSDEQIVDRAISLNLPPEAAVLILPPGLFDLWQKRLSSSKTADSVGILSVSGENKPPEPPSGGSL